MKKIIITLVMVIMVSSIAVSQQESNLHQGHAEGYVVGIDGHPDGYQIIVFTARQDGIWHAGSFAIVYSIDDDSPLVHLVETKIRYRIDGLGQLDYIIDEVNMDERMNDYDIDYDQLFDRLQGASVTVVRYNGNRMLQIGDISFLHIP